jgi:hypothetical protein
MILTDLMVNSSIYITQEARVRKFALQRGMFERMRQLGGRLEIDSGGWGRR